MAIFGRMRSMQTSCVPLALFIVLAAIGSNKCASAQEWPQRPVKIIVPYAAGGNSDVIGRVIARHLSDAFGQPFVVENRPGASGAIAAEAVARSPADGYTLFLASLPQIAIMPAALKTSFDPLKDVVPISAVASNPLALVVHPSLPVHSVADFVGYTRERKGQVTYAAVGIAGTTRLAMALFLKRAEIEMTPVFYKGGAPAVTDLIAGHVNAHFAIASIVVPYATGDMLRFLAVSSAQRLPQIPNVPTMSESGYPGFNLNSWTGLMAPVGIPKEIVDRIAREASRAVKDSKTAALLTASGIDPLGSSPDEFAAMIAADIPLWAEAVNIAGVRQK
jgi:tripartite-type tricarboxylate transporter receptor subunit TctC